MVSIKTLRADRWLPVSKVAPNTGLTSKVPTGVVCCGDAGRLWQYQRLAEYLDCAGPAEVRYIIGVYEQMGDYKIFRAIYDFVIQMSEAATRRLYGGITESDVFLLKAGVSDRTLHPEQTTAKAWVERRVRDLRTREGILHLATKFDSKTQRRVQCTANLVDMLRIASSGNVMVRGPESTDLPSLYSPQRKLKKTMDSALLDA